MTRSNCFSVDFNNVLQTFLAIESFAAISRAAHRNSFDHNSTTRHVSTATENESFVCTYVCTYVCNSTFSPFLATNWNKRAHSAARHAVAKFCGGALHG